MTIGAATRMLEREYKKAKQIKFIHNPLAWALYQVWKEADRKGDNVFGNTAAHTAERGDE